MVIEHGIILKANNQVIFFKKFDAKLFKTRKFIPGEGNSSSSEALPNNEASPNQVNKGGKLLTIQMLKVNHAIKPTQRGYFDISNKEGLPKS